MTLVIAHRGASKDAPENTLAAFALAIEQAADMIELDLHLAADGSVPIYHDDDLGGKPVGALTLDEVRQHDEAIPTLEEVLDAFGARLPLNLELKTRRRYSAYPGLCARAIEAVRARGLLDRMLFSSFGATTLDELRELCPDARVGVLATRDLVLPARGDRALIDRAKTLRAEAVHLSLRMASTARVARLRDAGLDVNVYTVDSASDQIRLIDAGVTGIFTNRPGEMRQLLLRRAMESQSSA